MVEPPGDGGRWPGPEGGAGVGLGRPGQQGGVLLRHRDPGGQEVHVQRDRLLHHRAVVVTGLARHVGVEVRPRYFTSLLPFYILSTLETGG